MVGGAAAGAAAGAVVDGGAPGAIVGAGVGAFAGAILCGDYDSDGDGVPDNADRCPSGWVTKKRWCGLSMPLGTCFFCAVPP